MLCECGKTETRVYMKYTKQNIQEMEQRYRAHFINSLSGFKSANLVGTRNAQGLNNLCIVSSVVHLGTDPALMAFINRPHTVERHTLENILETGFYTFNQVSTDLVAQAHHTSARYDRHESEFEMANLTPFDLDFPAPFVAESSIRIGLRLVEKVELSVNNTIMLIGEIEQVHIESEEWIATDGKVAIERANTVCVSGLDEYHRTQSLARLPYAKPNNR